jgi:hypothetical protein
VTIPDNDSIGGGDSVPAIVALFEAERAEVQNILGHALNIDTMDHWAKSAHISFPDHFKTQHGYRERR